MKGKENIDIYIVEDNKVFALVLKSELETSFPKEKFNIVLFETGEECREKMNVSPDLVLVDYHLNSENEAAMDGLAVIDMIRAKSPKTDFIMITGDRRTELFLRSMDHHVYDYLPKGSNVKFNLNLSISRWLNYREMLNS